MAEFLLTPQMQSLQRLSDLRGETVFIVSKETSKPIRCNPNGTVTANGGLGAHARFRVRRGDRPHRLGPVVRFENVGTGKFLAIKNGQLTIGGGGDHCEFIVEWAGRAVFLKKHHNPGARIGFNPNGQPVPSNALGDGSRGRFFIFDVDSVVPGRKPAHGHGQQKKAQAQHKSAVAAAHAAAKPQAAFTLTPQIKALALRGMAELRGETVFIVNKATSKPISVAGNGGVTALGNLGPRSQFFVRRGDRRHRLGPVVRFQNVATNQYLAIKSGALTLGSGGEHCEFIVEMAQQAVFLKKHNNPGARIGFNENGTAVEANTLGNGDRGRFFIFDCSQVVAVRPAAAAVPVPQQITLTPRLPGPGVRGIIKLAGADLCLHAHGGAREEAQIMLHGGVQFALSNAASHFVFQNTAFPSTYIIRPASSNQGPYVHAWGGIKPGLAIKLHGDEKYARTHPNSKFQVMQLQGTPNFLLRVHSQNPQLCIQAGGGPVNGSALILNGNVPQASVTPHAQFQFLPLP